MKVVTKMLVMMKLNKPTKLLCKCTSLFFCLPAALGLFYFMVSEKVPRPPEAQLNLPDVVNHETAERRRYTPHPERNLIPFIFHIHAGSPCAQMEKCPLRGENVFWREMLTCQTKKNLMTDGLIFGSTDDAAKKVRKCSMRKRLAQIL